MLQFEAAALWKSIQKAKASGNHAEERKLMKQYDELISRYPHEDDEEILERRLQRIEKALRNAKSELKPLRKREKDEGERGRRSVLEKSSA